MAIIPRPVPGGVPGERYCDPRDNPARTFPAQIARVETGTIQFGNDWPGMFFRGDDALAKATELRALAVALRGSGLLNHIPAYLDRLADEFASCSVNDTRAA